MLEYKPTAPVDCVDHVPCIMFQLDRKTELTHRWKSRWSKLRDKAIREAIGCRVANDRTDTDVALLTERISNRRPKRPLPLPNGPTINFSYVAGPSGARIELVERPGLKPGQ